MNIFMMRGLPGSGKSTTARNLQMSLGKEKVPIVSKDAIRKMLFPNTYYKDVDLYLVENIRNDILRRLKGDPEYDNIIIDETFIEVGDIINATYIFTEADQFYFIDHTSVDFMTCLIRQNDRSPLDRVDQQAMIHFARMLEKHNVRFKEMIEPNVVMVDYRNIHKEDVRDLFSRTHRDEGISVS